MRWDPWRVSLRPHRRAGEARIGWNETPDDLERRLLAAEAEIRRLREVEARLRASAERSGGLAEGFRAREAGARRDQIVQADGAGSVLERGLLGARVPDSPHPPRMAGLREDEERFSAVAEQAEVGIALADRDGRIIWANARQCEVMDRRLDQILGHTIAELTSPEDWPANERMFRRMIEVGEPFVIEKRWKAKDMPPRWSRLAVSPRRDGSRRIAGGIAITLDITDRKRVEIALRQSEERLRTAVGVGRLGLWDWDIVTGQVHWSEEHFRLQGYAVGEVAPSYQAWLARLHPDDRGPAERALERARDTGEEFSHEFRAVHPDGSVHWFHGRGRFFYADGRPLRMVGAMVEVTERREWAERQRALVAERQHRTRNLLGVVRSMSRKTARTSADLADFQGRFNDRLGALARRRACCPGSTTSTG